MTSCPHITNSTLFPPTSNDSVYREDCTICFDSIDDTAGLDVCLHCFNGGCSGDRNHAEQHAQLSSHPLALNIKRTRKRKQEREDGEPPGKITKLAIQAETKEDRYDVQTSVRCHECKTADLAKEGDVGRVVDGIMKANTFATEAEVQAWEQELELCEHTLMLEQEPGAVIPSGDLGHCRECDLKENLWLCLTCGNLGCGRKNYMGIGPPGNNHQVEHNQTTGHPVAVKLGSLTADGHADIHCYACDEERLDDQLVEHLANWGVDIAGRVKTEKSVTEMQLEHNLTYDFSMTTADGQELKALFGAGLTGLKNLGNSCYLASVLQALFSFDEFRDRYYSLASQLGQPIGRPADDLETQLRKVADGLLSGRYSVPDKDLARPESGEQAWQKGLAPAMLKHLIGKGHAEFSTMRQQDSFELLQHLLKLISRTQSSSDQQTIKNGGESSDPVAAFRFVMEQRLQCLSCKKLRYRQDTMESLSVNVPIKTLSQSDTPMTNGEQETDKEKEKFEPVTLEECLKIATAQEQVELKCSGCGNMSFTKQQGFKTFPNILAVVANRFGFVNWVPTKFDIPVIVGNDPLDLRSFRAIAKQPGEEELSEEATTADNGGDSPFKADEGALATLMEMGFPRIRCEKALHATGNFEIEAASAWLFEHMDDADIDAPVDFGGGAGQPPAAVNEADIAMLTAMGFSVLQARQALKETGSDAERAVDWLFSHPDAAGDFGDGSGDFEMPAPAAAGTTAATSAPALVGYEGDEVDFSLRCIVCHKGASIHAGHYVAFVKKQLETGEAWVLFNDEKVALGGDVVEMKKFAYIYFLRRDRA